MDFIERKQKFYDRFGLHDSVSEEEAKESFRVGICNILRDIDTKISEDEINRFCSWFGFETQWEYTTRNVLNFRYGYNLVNCIFNEQNWIKYLHKIESLFSLAMQKNENHRNYKKELFQKVKEIFSNSTLAIDIIDSNGTVIVIPTGCAFLDEELVIKVLTFLNEESHNHFVSGLKAYSNNNGADFIKSAESMRRSLEEFLRFLFSNRKGLDSNIKLLGSCLKKMKKQVEINNLFHKFLDYLDKFFNENSKHNDGDIGEAECELIILETGLILKYLNNIRHSLVRGGTYTES